MNRDEALTTAGGLINGDRARDYGDARENFGRIADLWSAQFRHKLTEPFTAADVALGLTHLKLSRIANTPDHADSFVDALGYVALGAELATPSRAAEQGFRVGARVRVLPTSAFMPGTEGTIVSEETYAWRRIVQLDNCSKPSDMPISELEVIQ